MASSSIPQVCRGSRLRPAPALRCDGAGSGGAPCTDLEWVQGCVEAQGQLYHSCTHARTHARTEPRLFSGELCWHSAGISFGSTT